MPKNVRANIEFGLNIIIAVAVLVVAGIIVKRYVFQTKVDRESLTRQSQSSLGTTLHVQNVNWDENKKTLVFFLKKDCTYCTQSAPFYRQLISDALRKNVRCLAILPDSLDQSRKYLQYLELPIETVETGSLSSFKVFATPTVFFVDNQGTVKSVWVGAVPGRENEMREQLNALFEKES